MKVTSLELNNFRNFQKIKIEPHEGVNIFYGDNAQGKTNLLESIWLCTGAKSFRESKDSELIKFNENFAKINLEFFSNERQQSVEIKFGEKKQVSLNKISDIQITKLSEAFNAVVFSPDHLSLVKAGPEMRRKFIDFALCSLKPSMGKLLNNYQRAVFQRNSLIKSQYDKTNFDFMLDMWEDTIAKLGSQICRQRNIYIEKLLPFAADFFDGLSNGKEKLNLYYSGKEFATEDDSGYKKLKEILLQSRKTDIEQHITSAGPHRHNLEIEINGISAKNFGSQGQQRSVALALKLAEASVLNQYSGEQPVVLLDDVMSELDSNRQNYILNCLKGLQVFITCCDVNQILNLTKGKAFNIKNGEVV